MIHTTKLVKLGNNLVVVLPRDFVKNHNLEKGDTIQAAITLLSILKYDVDPVVKTYRCRACQHQFTSLEENADLVYCPSCGEEKGIKEIDDIGNDLK